MSLSVKHLNADSSFYLTFSPPYALDHPKDSCPGSFTILIDPWLTGPSKIWTSFFSIQQLVAPACVNSLAELPPPDLILVSQDKPDHCHRQTLLQLPSDTDAIILGTRAAARKIRSWKHFNPLNVIALRTYNPRIEESIFRIVVPPFSPTGTAGEVTISLIAPKFDITGLHNAIGITYRPPSSVLSVKPASFVNLPSLPPLTSVTTSHGSRPSTPTPNSATVQPSPLAGIREKTLSVLYSPHGTDYDLVKSFASTHLLDESALPLTALIHSFNRCSNPWWMGGTICAGSPAGTIIARNLFARAWISAHDEEKMNRGFSVMQLKIERHVPSDIKEKLQSVDSGIGMVKTTNSTELVALDPGQEFVIAGK